MTPSCLTDDELLRHYSELFRAHPATAELAERMAGGSAAAKIEDELDTVRTELCEAETENGDLQGQIDSLAQVLEDFLDDTSAANAKAARKVLDSLR